MRIRSPLPIMEVDHALVVLCLGNPAAAQGERVDLIAQQDNSTLRGYTVTDVVTALAIEQHTTLLQMYGYADAEAFMASLENVYGVGLPRSATVTAYVLHRVNDSTEEAQ